MDLKVKKSVQEITKWLYMFQNKVDVTAGNCCLQFTTYFRMKKNTSVKKHDKVQIYKSDESPFSCHAKIWSLEGVIVIWSVNK